MQTPLTPPSNLFGGVIPAPRIQGTVSDVVSGLTALWHKIYTAKAQKDSYFPMPPLQNFCGVVVGGKSMETPIFLLHHFGLRAYDHDFGRSVMSAFGDAGFESREIGVRPYLTREETHTFYKIASPFGTPLYVSVILDPNFAADKPKKARPPIWHLDLTIPPGHGHEFKAWFRAQCELKDDCYRKDFCYLPPFPSFCITSRSGEYVIYFRVPERDQEPFSWADQINA